MAASSTMTAAERRASVSLAGVFALRMFGLFLIMPVLSIYAQTVPGGDNTLLIGLAIGIYGLTQALLYIPYGWLSDRLGRKPVIVAGLVIFAIGSLVAALAHDMTWIIIGRAIQGAGAISSAVTALLADLTTEENRTKGMAMVGGSIALSFAAAITLAPILYHWVGMSGLFTLIGSLAVIAIGVVLWIVPDPTVAPEIANNSFSEALRHTELLRLNFGVFVLHAIQSAFFVIVPRLIENAGLPIASHWKIYLPVILIAFVLMVPAIVVSEKRNKTKPMMLIAIALIFIAQAVLGGVPDTLTIVIAMLFVYFVGFNVLEAVQPSMVSKFAPGHRRGAAMGVYNTTQALGLFAGGAFGGWLLSHHGASAVFLFCAGSALLWLIIAFKMKTPPRNTTTAGAH